jgi:hypothetical protein
MPWEELLLCSRSIAIGAASAILFATLVVRVIADWSE